MSFSSSFSSGYNIGSGIKDRYKAKKDLEKHNDFTGKILSDFIIPQLGEEDQEKAAIMMEQLNGEDVSPRGKSQGISSLLSAFSGQIVEEKSREAKEELKGQLGQSNAFVAKIFGEKWGDNQEMMDLLNDAMDSENPGVTASNLQGLMGYAQNQAADEVRNAEVATVKEYMGLGQQNTQPDDIDLGMGELGPFADPKKKSGEVGAQGPVGGQGPAGPPIEEFVDFSVIKDAFKDKAPQAGVADISRLSDDQARELVNLARPLFPKRDLDFKKRFGGYKVEWKDKKLQRHSAPKGSGKENYIDDDKSIDAKDFLKLPQVSQFLQRNNGARLNEMAAEGEVRNQEILKQQYPDGLPGRPSAPVAQAAVAAQAEGPAVDPFAATGLNTEQKKGMDEALEGYSVNSQEEIWANLSPANKTKDLLQSYFKHAGSNASLGGLQSALTMVGTIDEMMHPAGNSGESINETHTEKLALRQNIIDRLANLSKVARGTKGVATGRINQMIIQMRKGIGLSIGPEATALEQAHHGVANAMLRAMSGAAVTEHEMKRVMEQVGNLHLSDKEYIQRVDAELQAHRDALQTSYNMFAAQGYSIPAQWYQSAAGQSKVNTGVERMMLLLKAKQQFEKANRN
jgi:hypothetical protein